MKVATVLSLRWFRKRSGVPQRADRAVSTETWRSELHLDNKQGVVPLQSCSKIRRRRLTHPSSALVANSSAKGVDLHYIKRIAQMSEGGAGEDVEYKNESQVRFFRNQRGAA